MRLEFGPWSKVRPFWVLLLVCAVCVAYANHFRNSFHFDDGHTVIENPHIRSLGNLPKFFTDASTLSVLPANQSWRPLVTTSLAIDYYFGGGLNPIAFHISTFLLFLVEIALLVLLFERLFDQARPSPPNPLLAVFAAGLYGLHPACAETVNYVIQRSDVYSTLGVIAGLLLYIVQPDWRMYGVYLIPVTAGLLSKPPALVFPVLLLVYVWLFEGKRWRAAFRAVLPSFAVCGILGIIQIWMTPASFTGGAVSSTAYRITQPFVALRYFESFFLPVRLSADTDLTAVPGIFDPQALAGFAFVAAILLAAILCSLNRETKPVAFGLWWFLIALAPTSLFPLAELENDHRMFFPFVGLVVSAVWALALVWRAAPLSSLVARKAIAPVAALLLLAACAWGTHERNEVWRSEASLWKDVTIKSPKNGRGLMNYGLALMGSGDLQGASSYLQRALLYAPAYEVLQVNLGILSALLGKDADAEQHFQRAMALAPQSSLPYFYYARWLNSRGRTAEALIRVEKALALNPSTPGAEALLAQIQAAKSNNTVAQAEHAVAANPTGENYLALSIQYHRAGRYADCVRTATEAAKLKPGYAEAYNNIAAGYEALGQWKEAIEAAREALRLKPDFALARNNLAWSEAQMASAGKVTR